MNTCKNNRMKQFCILLLCVGLPLGFLMQPVGEAADKIIVPEGTRIALQLNGNLSTKSNEEGDVFDAYVIEPVYSEGQIVIPRGSVVSGSISRITRPGRFKGKAVMHLLFQSIQIPGHGNFPILASLARIDSDDDMDIHTEHLQESVRSGGNNFKAGRGKSLNVADLGMANVFWTRGKDLELHRGSTMEISLKQSLKIPLKGPSAEKPTLYKKK